MKGRFYLYIGTNAAGMPIDDALVQATGEEIYNPRTGYRAVEVRFLSKQGFESFFAEPHHLAEMEQPDLDWPLPEPEAAVSSGPRRYIIVVTFDGTESNELIDNVQQKIEALRQLGYTVEEKDV